MLTVLTSEQACGKLCRT